MCQTKEAIPALQDPARSNDPSGIVVSRVPQGYDTNINIRLVPGRDIQLTPHRFGCRPRQGAPRRDAEPVDLPESLGDKLKDANKKVIDWLALDPANAQLFLAKPVEALVKAGVELSRAEQKALTRTHRAVAEASVVAPGVKVASLSASAHPTGRVGKLPPGLKGSNGREGREADCGCGPKGKE